MKVLYSSLDIQLQLTSMFNNATPKAKKTIIVAYVGSTPENILPTLYGVTVICCPKAGATSPIGIRKLINQGAEVFFSDNLHMKVYWVEGQGCVIGSANLSYNGLQGGLKEAAIYINDKKLDIDKLIREASPRIVTKRELDKLEKETDRLAKQTNQITRHNLTYPEWFESPLRKEWKIGWWEESIEHCAKEASSKLQLEYNITKPHSFLNIEAGQAVADEWLLMFRVYPQKATNCMWLYVDFISEVYPDEVDTYEEEYPSQAVQIFKSTRYNPPPFIINKGFREALNLTIKHFGQDFIFDNKTLVPPEDFLAFIYQKYQI